MAVVAKQIVRVPAFGYCYHVDPVITEAFFEVEPLAFIFFLIQESVLVHQFVSDHVQHQFAVSERLGVSLQVEYLGIISDKYSTGRAGNLLKVKLIRFQVFYEDFRQFVVFHVYCETNFLLVTAYAHSRDLMDAQERFWDDFVSQGIEY